MNNEFKISFELTEQALINWLHELSVEHNVDSCKHLLGVLQAFKTINITRQQLFSFLTQISSELDSIVEQLEKTYLDAGFPLEPEEQIKADLVTLIYTSLAENWASLGRKLLERHSSDNRLEKAMAFYLSLQALGKALLNQAKVYMKPDEGFWLNCYQIYNMAEDAGLLAIKTEAGERTINSAFKHILIFELSDTGQYRPREMKAIYSALKDMLTEVDIKTDCKDDSIQNLCVFNLNQDLRPHELLAPPRKIDADDRFISPLPAAKNLHQFLQQESSRYSALKSINHSFFQRAIKSLGHTQKRKFNRKKEHFSITGIVGFNQVASYLYKLNNVSKEPLNQKPKRDPRFAGKWEAPDLDLVPIGEESIQQLETQLKTKKSDDSSILKIIKVSRELSSNSKVWNPIEIEKNNLVETIPTGEFQIIDSSAQGFLGSWKSLDIKVRIGDIFALPTAKGDRVEVGLIRRIIRPTREDVFLGIEIIGFESEAVRMFRPERKQQIYSAILLPGIPALKQADSIIYNTSDFSTGEFVNIRRGKENLSCRLNKLINATAAVNHMELYFNSETH